MSKLNLAGRNIAAIGNSEGGGGDLVDFSAGMMALTEAQVMFAANVSAVKTANEMSGNLLDPGLTSGADDRGRVPG